MRQHYSDEKDNGAKNSADIPVIDLMYLSDKNTQKPLWIDQRFNEFLSFISNLQRKVQIDSNVTKILQLEKNQLLRDFLKFLPS